MAVHGLLVQVTEHDGVLGYLGRPGDLDGRGGVSSATALPSRIQNPVVAIAPPDVQRG
jgi:hypothetical protein